MKLIVVNDPNDSHFIPKNIVRESEELSYFKYVFNLY